MTKPLTLTNAIVVLFRVGVLVVIGIVLYLAFTLYVWLAAFPWGRSFISLPKYMLYRSAEAVGMMAPHSALEAAHTIPVNRISVHEAILRGLLVRVEKSAPTYNTLIAKRFETGSEVYTKEYRLFLAIQRPHATPKSSAHPDRVYILIGSRSTIKLAYDSVTGEIGRDGDWWYVSDEFRKWVQEQFRKVPSDPPKWVLREVLPKARAIDLQYVGDGRPRFVWPISQHNGTGADMLALLRKSQDFRTRPPSRVPVLQFAILDIEEPDGTHHRAMKGLPVYQYVWETGELGTGDEWCVVPEEFRKDIEYLWLGSGVYLETQREGPKDAPHQVNDPSDTTNREKR